MKLFYLVAGRSPPLYTFQSSPPVVTIGIPTRCSSLVLLGSRSFSLVPPGMSVNHRRPGRGSPMYDSTTFYLRQDRVYKLQDNYQRCCNKTGPDSHLYRLGCSQCLIIHNPCHFSAGQICPNTSPKSRTCAGLEGFIELCEHFSWSAECLWRGIRVLEGLKLRCTFPHNNDIHGNIYNDLQLIFLKPILCYDSGGVISICRAFPLFK